MKKLIIATFFMFLFIICAAPNITEELRVCVSKRLIHNFYKSQYDKEFNDFINHLGFKESRNNWTIINSINCFGEWQIAHSTLIHLGYGYITPNEFRDNPFIFPRKLQIEVLKTLISINELSLKPYENYIGTTINGILITKSGLLAGMHLGGLSGIKYFLMSNGNIDKTDENGTKISDYIKEFSIYDLSKKYLDEQFYIYTSRSNILITK